MLYMGEFTPDTDIESKVNTLNNLFIELSASRDVVLLDSDSYYSGEGPPLLDFLDRQIETLEIAQDLPNELRSFPKLGTLLTRFEMALVGDDPIKAKEMAQILIDQIPSSIRNDGGSNWKLWAGRITPWEFLQQMKQPATVLP